MCTGELPIFVGERWLNQASCAKTPSRTSALQLICPGVEISMAIVEKGIRTCGFRCEGFGSLRQLEHAWTHGISNMKVICNYIIVRAKWSHSLSKRVIQSISWRLSLIFFCGQHHNFSKAMDVETPKSHQPPNGNDATKNPFHLPLKSVTRSCWLNCVPQNRTKSSSFTQIVSNKPEPKSHIWGKPILIRIRGNFCGFSSSIWKWKEHKRALASENPWRKVLALFPTTGTTSACSRSHLLRRLHTCRCHLIAVGSRAQCYTASHSGKVCWKFDTKTYVTPKFTLLYQYDEAHVMQVKYRICIYSQLFSGFSHNRQ